MVMPATACDSARRRAADRRATVATVVPVTDPPPPAPWYKENWWVVAVVAVLLAALIIGIILWTGDDDGDEEVSGVDSTLATSIPSSTVPESTAPASTAPATTVPETTEAATTTVAPTTEPATTTVAPTTVAPTTAAPTTVAPTTAAPTTTVAPPPPMSINGVGDDTRQISIPGGGLGVATITNDGQTNFEVLALDENENLIEDVVVTIGPYEGSVVLPEGTNFLEITAEGAWTIEVMAPAAAPAFNGEEAAGSGDRCCATRVPAARRRSRTTARSSSWCAPTSRTAPPRRSSTRRARRSAGRDARPGARRRSRPTATGRSRSADAIAGHTSAMPCSQRRAFSPSSSTA